MTAALSIKNNVNNLNNFFSDITSGNNSYYFFVGHTQAWPDDNNPPPANSSISQTEQTIYHEMIYGKLITNNNIAFMIPNIPWVSNTVYVAYDPANPNYYGSNSYAVTPDYSVYKCIDNSSNSASLIQPNIKSTTGTFQTSDGYIWKYMYTIPTNPNTTFTTNQYVPVVPNTYVTNNATGGTIDVIRIPNGGSDWQAYAIGYVQSVLSYNSLVISSNSVAINDYYTGSSIYLKAGLGADQIRLITGYNGANKTITVSPAFNTFVNLQLNNGDLTGIFTTGQVVIQNITQAAFLYQKGFFNQNDTVQQADTLATGAVSHANSILMQLHGVVGTFSPYYPIYNTTDAFFTLAGKVSITSGSNTLVGTTANLLTLAVNSFIQVGANASLNMRRIATITNSTYGTVSLPWSHTLVANTFAQVNNAVEPTSLTVTSSNGIISQYNLNSLSITYGNSSVNSIAYIPGETVKSYNAIGADQAANGIISFANSTTLILSNVNGVINNGTYLTGLSSQLSAQVLSITSYPNITLANALGTFVTGDKVYSQYANGVASGSATCLSYSYNPSGTTEYIIAPTVTIQGDGNGALAYSVVNTALNSSYEISDIIMINTGSGYTFANAAVTSNSLYGNNAIVQPIVSPIVGHGGDPVTELGAKFGGISMTFDTGVNENFYFPNYGTYRKVGIIKNPLFQQLYVGLQAPSRLNLNNKALIGSFVNNEIVYQYSTSAAGLVKSVNSTFMQLDNINGTFTSNAAQTGVNNMIVGLTSNATANVLSTNSVVFNITTNSQPIVQKGTNAVGYLTEVINSTMIVLANVEGKFAANQTLYDATNNTYSNSITLYVSNGTQLSTTFGQRFSQTSRVTLSSSTPTFFSVGEYVNQTVSNAAGMVIDNSHELDFIVNNVIGVFSLGTTLTDSNTTATGVITFANNSYLKITAANGIFNVGDSITSITGNGNIQTINKVILLTDITTPFQYNQNITGNTSGAVGYTSIANTITFPDLVRNSGQVLYINNVKPFTKSANTRENFYFVSAF
jgi:hypothetical protein